MIKSRRAFRALCFSSRTLFIIRPGFVSFAELGVFYRIVGIILRGFFPFFPGFGEPGRRKERKGPRGWLIRTVLYYLPNTPAWRK